MRHPIVASLCLIGIAFVAACDKDNSRIKDAIKDVNVIDESNLNDVMLTAADPDEAVTYFKRTAAANPDRIDVRRGLAKSLVRARKPTEAVAVWAQIVNTPEGTNDDRVAYADALIRANDWKKAQEVLNTIPPTFESYERYRLEAMVADSTKSWTKADSFYETAAGLTTTPAGVLNNWGYSKLTRGDYAGAEKLFTESLTYDPSVFTAKNNLVLARAAQRKYDMPSIEMSQTERAQLLYTAALSAIKQGDTATGRALLNDAVETHPQHFEEAARALETLDANVVKG